MTDLIYHHKFYTNQEPGHNLIIDLERTYIDKIIQNCKPTDLFINSVWFEYDDNMKQLLAQKPERIIIYSGYDWDDRGYRKSVHDKIKEHSDNIVYVGNTDGVGYFSFWLFFVEQNALKYKLDHYSSSPISKLFMSLNRRCHPHRVSFVKSLYENNLEEYGHISLGDDPENTFKPIFLPEDVNNEEGDKASGKMFGISNDITSLGNPSYWNNHLINIVTETGVNNNTFISEKTWKPILGFKPFMILGDYKVYEYLKDYGIDTFDDIFGTGYTNRDPKLREKWIIETLYKLKDKNYNDIYHSILPRLVKNKDAMSSIYKKNNDRFYTILNNL